MAKDKKKDKPEKEKPSGFEAVKNYDYVLYAGKHRKPKEK